MKWLTNTTDPSDRDTAYWALSVRLDQQRAVVWENWLQWLSDKHIGEPKEMPTLSVAKLKQMGYVGVYEVDTP